MKKRIDKRKIKIPYEVLDEYYWGRSLSIQEVADELGVSYGTIRRNLIQYHIPLRKPWQTAWTERKLDHKEYEKTIELYKRGIPVKMIAEHLGLSVSGVYGRLRRAGVELRDVSERAEAGNKTRRGKISPKRP